MKKVMYPSPNIKCEGCADTIKSALTPLSGVNAVQVDVASRRVTVDYDENTITPDAIQEHMAEVGFPSPGAQPVQ